MAVKTNDLVSENDIRLRSYFIWESEGYPSGREEEHWLRAEAELMSASAGPKSRKESSAKVTAVKKTQAKSSGNKGKSKTTATGNRSESR